MIWNLITGNIILSELLENISLPQAIMAQYIIIINYTAFQSTLLVP